MPQKSNVHSHHQNHAPSTACLSLNSPADPLLISQSTTPKDLLAKAEQFYSDKQGNQALRLYKRIISLTADCGEKPPLSQHDQGRIYYKMACIYKRALGKVEQSFPKAAEYFNNAAQLGHAKSKYELALMYMNGKGVGEQNIDHGRTLLMEAAQLGDKNAHALLNQVRQKIGSPPVTMTKPSLRNRDTTKGTSSPSTTSASSSGSTTPAPKKTKKKKSPKSPPLRPRNSKTKMTSPQIYRPKSSKASISSHSSASKSQSNSRSSSVSTSRRPKSAFPIHIPSPHHLSASDSNKSSAASTRSPSRKSSTSQLSVELNIVTETLRGEVADLRAQLKKALQKRQHDLLSARRDKSEKMAALEAQLEQAQNANSQLHLRLVEQMQENDQLTNRASELEAEKELNEAEKLVLLQRLSKVQRDYSCLEAKVQQLQQSKYEAENADVRLSNKLGALYRVPSLQPLHVAREGVIKDVRVSLIDHSIVALTGVEQSGKTCLCLELAHDTSTRKVFSDGIVYARAHSNSRKIPSDMVNALSEDFLLFNQEDESSITNLLASYIKAHPESKILYIIDDVSTIEQLNGIVEAASLHSNSKFLIVSSEQTLDGARESISTYHIPSKLDLSTVESLIIKYTGQIALPIETIQSVATTGFHQFLSIELLLSFLSRSPPEEWQDSMIENFAFVTTQEEFLHAIMQRLFSLDDMQNHRILFVSFGAFLNTTLEISTVLIEELSPFTSEQTHSYLHDLETMHVLKTSACGKMVILSTHVVRHFFEQFGEEYFPTLHLNLINTFRKSLQTNQWSSFSHPSKEYSDYFFTFLSYHLRSALLNDELCSTLMLEPRWYSRKLSYFFDAEHLIEDLDIASEECPIFQLVRGALLLMSDFVATHPTAVYSLLLGKLSHIRHEVIQNLLKSVKEEAVHSHLLFCEDSHSSPLFPFYGMLHSVFREHKSTPLCVSSVSIDDTFVISGDHTSTFLWSIDTGHLLNTFPSGSVALTTAVMNRIRVAVLAGMDHTLRVYPLEKVSAPLKTLKFSAKYVLECNDVHDLLVLVDTDNCVFLWDMFNPPNKIYHSQEANIGGVRCYNNVVFILLEEQPMTVMYTLSTQNLDFVSLKEYDATCLGISHDGNSVLFVDNDSNCVMQRKVYFPETEFLAQLHLASQPTAEVWATENVMVFPQDDQLIFADAQTGKVVKRFTAHNDMIKSTMLSKSGRFLFTISSTDFSIRIWDLHRFAEFDELLHHDHWSATNAESSHSERDANGIFHDAFDSENSPQTFAHGGKLDSSVFVAQHSMIAEYSLSSNRIVKTFSGHKDNITAIAASSTFLVSGTSCESEDDSIRVWNRESGELIHRLVNPQLNHLVNKSVSRILLDEQSSRRVYASSHTGVISCWSVDSGEMLHQFAKQAHKCLGLCMRHSNRELLSWGFVSDAGSQIVFWNTQNGEEVASIDVNSNENEIHVRIVDVIVDSREDSTDNRAFALVEKDTTKDGSVARSVTTMLIDTEKHSIVKELVPLAINVDLHVQKVCLSAQRNHLFILATNHTSNGVLLAVNIESGEIAAKKPSVKSMCLLEQSLFTYDCHPENTLKVYQVKETEKLLDLNLQSSFKTDRHIREIHAVNGVVDNEKLQNGEQHVTESDSSIKEELVILLGEERVSLVKRRVSD
uniref:APAF-1 helical domain-containing protein n=1 Tax=Percolomonas cosmopolitus TaxID=63605 RepID=A0A7S1KL74_9EUKA